MVMWILGQKWIIYPENPPFSVIGVGRAGSENTERDEASAQLPGAEAGKETTCVVGVVRLGVVAPVRLWPTTSLCPEH